MDNPSTSFLEIDGIRKKFGSLEVLQDVNIDVAEGGFLVLVGPSGCGKSTLLNLIAGFEQATAGDIRLGGRSIMDLHPSKRDIAMVFQSYALYPNMNVADNIGFGMETRGIPKIERNKRIAEVAEILQIGQLLKRKPSQLSGGQRQRVAMGRALVRDPQAFLFDEPLSNLDARLRVDMRAEIKKLHTRLGTTIVYVTHDQVEAMTLASKIAVLKHGVVQQVGTPESIYNKPANTFVADFMGSPAMNQIRGNLVNNNGQLELIFANNRLIIPEGSEELLSFGAQNKQVHFGIRAEDISLASAEHSIAQTGNSAKMTVELVEPTGADTYVVASDEDATLTARVANNVKPLAGETVSLLFDMSKTHIFDGDTGMRIQ